MTDSENSVLLGSSRPVDDLATFTAELVRFRGEQERPLTFGEFQRLINSNSPSRPPLLEELTAYDPVLALSDDQLKAAYPKIRPFDIRRLRRGFLEKEAKAKHSLKAAYEAQILSLIRPQVISGRPTLHHYTAYLLAFHSQDLAAFFRPWALGVSVRDLKAHSYIGAGSGHGKSELIKAMMYTLMKQGYGIILLDPHGDIAEQVAHWPEFAQDPERLCYFSPYLAGKNAQGESLYCVPGINPLSTLHQNDDLDSVVENFIATIGAIIGTEGDISTRMKTVLRPCLYTLAKYPNTTLYDLLAFISESDPDNAPWVNRAKKTLTNRSQLDTLESFFDKHYATTKNAIRDRLRALLASDALDKCLTSENTIDLETMMNAGKVMVFNLSAGILGNETSAGFGRFLLCALQNTALRRQRMAAQYRKSVFLFMDEGDRFTSDAVISIYKETRKYGLHITFAQQITGFGMDSEMWRAISGNSRVRFAGSAGGDKTTERDLSYMAGVEADDLKQLKPLNFYLKSADHEPILFTLSKNLLGQRHAMTASEWDHVKAYQLAAYYRTNQGKKNPLSTAKIPTTSSPNEHHDPELNFDY